MIIFFTKKKIIRLIFISIFILALISLLIYKGNFGIFKKGTTSSGPKIGEVVLAEVDDEKIYFKMF